MSEKKNNEEAPQTLTVEQQNHLMLKEILHNVRWMRRVYTTSLIITITFIVLPIIGAIVVLPKIINTFTGVLTQYGKDSGLAPNGNIFDLFNQIQNGQNANGNTNANTQ
jgi:hypothetical protein